ncbi:hypothetical protein GGR50DRAFT_576048 [Xylaria sp. CBS 124048]|nr:hypothetical protein GGR50DRAFT_576048 [Xylaria sp. CBS 124048]
MFAIHLLTHLITWVTSPSPGLKSTEVQTFSPQATAFFVASIASLRIPTNNPHVKFISTFVLSNSVIILCSQVRP